MAGWSGEEEKYPKMGEVILQGTKRIVEALGLDKNKVVIALARKFEDMRYSREPSKHVLEDAGVSRSTNRWTE